MAAGSLQEPVRRVIAAERERKDEGQDGMDYDTDKIDEAVLALLSLTVHDESEYGARSWKGHDWDALNRLYEKGLISNPVSKAKSVVLTPEGLAKSRELFDRLFAKEE